MEHRFDDFYKELDKYNTDEIQVQHKCLCKDVVNDNGVFICRDCGIETDTLLEDAEWRYYGADDTRSTNPTRCGMPINALLPQSSLGTVIGYSYNTNNSDTRKIRNFNTWNGMPYKERSLYNVFNIISQKCDAASLPKCIIDESKILYKSISNKKISRGNNRKGLIAATVYHACKNKNVPRSTKEIAKIFDIKIGVMTKGNKQFYDLYNSIHKKKIKSKTPTQPVDFIERFASALNLPDNVCEKSKEFAIKAFDNKLTCENTPPSIAVGCIYLACNLSDYSINKKFISKNCNISEVTINKCYKKLNDNKELLIN